MIRLPAMTEPDAILSDPHAAAAIARAERRLEILAELTAIGMGLARGVERQAAGQEPAHPDPITSFARLSRAIRLTLTLESRTDAELTALRAGAASELEARRKAVGERERAVAVRTSADHRRMIERAVREAIESETPDPHERLAGRQALHDHLQYDEGCADLDAMTFTQAVQRICADLGLAPDWSDWTEDGWKAARRPALAQCDDTAPAPRTGWPSG
jgi:hypothetical protein